MRIPFSVCIFFFLLLFFPFQEVSAQGQKPYGEFSSGNIKTQKKLLKSARKESDGGNYLAAIEKYTELLKIDSTNPMFNLEMGQTLFNNFRQQASIPYYEKAIKYSKDTLGEAYYFLASAYHIASNFELAQKNYKTYLSMISVYGTGLMAEEEKDMKDEIKHKMEMCDNGKKLIQSPADKFTLNGKTRSFQILNVGENVNSGYDEYGAVLSANDSLLYFTARREENTGGKFDWDDKYFEDIYFSRLEKKGWGESVNIGPPINTKKHEAIISISPDGKTMHFYRGIKQGTFFSSQRVGNSWRKPEKLYKESDINSTSWETSLFGFTLAGDELYVVSDRDGGIGGRDIYFTKKQSNGSWGPLENLGEPINTKYDEDAPFITPDGKTMYFSSTGHNSMGGFDIFKSERQGNKWSEPVNLGVPFNTPGNDIYFMIANTSDKAYYSSNGKSPDRTDMNIYSIDICDDVPFTTISGFARGISNGTIVVSEKQSGNEVGSFDIVYGKYSVKLQHGKKYVFTLKTSAAEPASADVDVPRQCKVYELYQELNFPQAGQPLVFKNAFFDIKTEAGSMSYSEYLAKADKNTLANYSEVSVNTTPVAVATATVAATTTVTASTATTTASTPTVTASTATTTASTHTTTATTASTQTATTTSTTTTGSTTTTTISINNILFDYDKSAINEEFKSELDKAADFLKNTNKKAKIEVAGHTDSKGSDPYNLALSKRRAEAVANYLASKGISRSRIKTVGYGETKPVASNENPDGSDNPDGRAKNRRTEIVVVQ